MGKVVFSPMSEHMLGPRLKTNTCLENKLLGVCLPIIVLDLQIHCHLAMAALGV